MWETVIPLSNACVSSSRLRFSTIISRREGLPPSPASGIKRWVTTARLLQAGTSVPNSVDTWPVPERPGTSPTRPQNSLTILLQNTQESPHNMQISTNSLIKPSDDLVLAWKSGIPYWNWLRQHQAPIQTKWAQDSQNPGALRFPRKDCTLKQKDIPHKDARCAHQTSCMEHIVANVCLDKNN